jgi:ABC-2 type transport system permease protein
MTGFATLIGKELREQLRTYRLPIVAIIFVFFGISSPALARYLRELLDLIGTQATGGVQVVLPPPTVADAVEQLLKNMGQIGILIAILLAMGIVASEKDRGTAAFVLTKPASRLAFLLAKISAIGVTLAVAVAIGSVVGLIYTILLFDNASISIGGFAAMAVLVWLTVMAFAALTFLGSTVTSSAAAGAGFGFVCLIVIGLIGALPNVGDWMPTSLLGSAAAVALGQPAPVLAQGLVGTLVVISASFILSWWSFRRQEL